MARMAFMRRILTAGAGMQSGSGLAPKEIDANQNGPSRQLDPTNYAYDSRVSEQAVASADGSNHLGIRFSHANAYEANHQ